MSVSESSDIIAFIEGDERIFASIFELGCSFLVRMLSCTMLKLRFLSHGKTRKEDLLLTEDEILMHAAKEEESHGLAAMDTEGHLLVCLFYT